MRTYNEKEIRNIFKQQGYKYACLRDSDGKVRVTYNTEQTTNGASKKVDEAFKRLENMPDGLYTFCFLNSKGRNVTPDEYPFLKGNVAMDEGGKTVPYHIINQIPQSKNESDKVLSYSEVLNLKMELATVTFERNQYRNELEAANKTIAELESEIKELEAKTPLSEDASNPMKWVESLGSQLMPVVDRYFSIKEKELDKQQQAPQKPRVKKFTVPVIGSAEFEAWLDKLEVMPEDKFNNLMNFLQVKYPNHYNAINEAFSETGEEDLEEQEETEE